MKVLWQWVKRHPQRSMGIVQIALGSLATGLPTLDLKPRTLSMTLVVFGAITAVLGYLRSGQDRATALEHAARNHSGSDTVE